MKLLLNIGLAWVATFSMVILSIIWIFRVVKVKGTLAVINKKLRRNHIQVAYVCIGATFFHGMFSSFSLISVNYGAIALFVVLLLWATFSYRCVLKKLWIKLHRVLTILVIAIVGFHIVEVNGFVGPKKVITELVYDIKDMYKGMGVDIDKLSSSYEDGVYEGEGYGYRPGLKVSVKVKDGLIEDVSIVEHNEVGKMFYAKAFNVVPEEIVANQSIDVDVVSGATYTSRGIIEAVKNALNIGSK